MIGETTMNAIDFYSRFEYDEDKITLDVFLKYRSVIDYCILYKETKMFDLLIEQILDEEEK